MDSGVSGDFDPALVGPSTPVERSVLANLLGRERSSRAQRRSITLALPFGETPLDSEAGREFLQQRVALFAQISFALGLFAFVFYQVLITALPGYDFFVFVQQNGTIFQAGGFVLPFLLWLATRQGRRSLRTLLLLDALGTLLLLSSYAVMSFVASTYNPQRADLVMMLITICVVCLRAVVIPSTWPHTVAVGVLGSIPAIVLGYVNASSLMLNGAHVPNSVAVWYMVMWTVVGISISGVTSHVIYGLRVQVAQAARLGQYVLEEKVGEGGMGAVYRARHALLRRATAVKLVLPERAGPEVLARFEREVQLTASLTHPNTVSVYDYGRTPAGVFYYAMEFLDGIDLEQLVTRFGPQSPARVVHVLAQVAGSLGEAHKVGLVHRDVKPANIILCEQRGLHDTAKVVDFGLVKDLTRLSPALLTLSGSSSIVGTPLYLAPEAISAPDKLDARADLYALGAVGYFLLTGRPVFVGASLFEVAAQHLQQEPTPPSRLMNAPLSTALEALLLDCLSKDPAKRPASAEIVAERLAAAGVSPWSRTDAESWWAEFGVSARRRSPLPSESPGPKTVVIDLATRAR